MVVGQVEPGTAAGLAWPRASFDQKVVQVVDYIPVRVVAMQKASSHQTAVRYMPVVEYTLVLLVGTQMASC